MPIGMVLIVDQGHVQDVLRALANSRLRFCDTQIHIERFRGSITLGLPEPVDTPAAPPVTTRPNAPRGFVNWSCRAAASAMAAVSSGRTAATARSKGVVTARHPTGRPADR